MIARAGPFKALIFLGFLLLSVVIVLFAARLVPPAPGRLMLEPVAFGDLEGWAEDEQSGALRALLRSCGRIEKHPHTVPEGGRAVWLQVCEEAAVVDVSDDAAARAFFETHFLPHAMRLGDKDQGLLTGYYEPELRGSRIPTPQFFHPLYVRPADLITVDLGRFAADLKGRQIVGQFHEGALRPYPSRAEIAAGALAGQGAELLWVDDPVAAFFLEIQGSGRVRLEDDTVTRVGYAAKNGHPYRAIGRVLVDMGEMALEDVSLPTIRHWLKSHPERAREVMNANPSHVFFRELQEEGPVGSEGVVLTPGRSLAVDRRHIAMGIPLWIDSSLPELAGGNRLRRLTIAQDTGGAITGELRGDLFWGPGLEAEELAGHMREQARFVILIPRALANP